MFIWVGAARSWIDPPKLIEAGNACDHLRWGSRDTLVGFAGSMLLGSCLKQNRQIFSPYIAGTLLPVLVVFPNGLDCVTHP